MMYSVYVAKLISTKGLMSPMHYGISLPLSSNIPILLPPLDYMYGLGDLLLTWINFNPSIDT